MCEICEYAFLNLKVYKQRNVSNFPISHYLGIEQNKQSFHCEPSRRVHFDLSKIRKEGRDLKK